MITSMRWRLASYSFHRPMPLFRLGWSLQFSMSRLRSWACAVAQLHLSQALSNGWGFAAIRANLTMSDGQATRTEAKDAQGLGDPRAEAQGTHGRVSQDRRASQELEVVLYATAEAQTAAVSEPTCGACAQHHSALVWRTLLDHSFGGGFD